MRALLLVLLSNGAWGAPADTPIRVDLPVFDQPQEPATGESVNQPAPYAPSGAVEVGSAVGVGGGLGASVNLAGSLNGQKGAIFNNILAQKQAILTPQIQTGLFSAPVTKLESAVLQTEGIESKPLTVKENVQSIVAGIFQPKPIVDTITEDEKYGNNGDKFYTVGRAVVGGAEGFSNLVNSVITAPSVFFKKITRAASEKLNNFGGKLIGLA